MAKTKPDLKGNHKIISFQFYYGGYNKHQAVDCGCAKYQATS